jgi:hypothetical protein
MAASSCAGDGETMSAEDAFNSALLQLAHAPTTQPVLPAKPLAQTPAIAGAALSIAGEDRAVLLLQLLLEHASSADEADGGAAETNSMCAKEECLHRLHALLQSKLFRFTVRSAAADARSPSSEILGACPEQQPVAGKGEFGEFDDFDYEALGCF